MQYKFHFTNNKVNACLLLFMLFSFSLSNKFIAGNHIEKK